MYGTAKVHKDNVPLRPILAMIDSPQHATAKWLAKLLEPVSTKYSQYVVMDSFEFSETVRQFHAPDSVRMCSYDIKSLYTNVPQDETIRICVRELYHSDMEPPLISEKSFTKLIEKVAKSVEFSFNEVMYKQIDGVAMGSPLGPVLANIFVGAQEQKLDIENRSDILMYKRYVDDTFTLHLEEEQSIAFENELNGLHRALKFTSEHEREEKLPYLEVNVHKTSQKDMKGVLFETSVYRKSTFTGLYTRWDSFTAQKYKINLIKCLANRVKRICSPKYLSAEFDKLRQIFTCNGFPKRVVDRILEMVQNPKPSIFGPAKCPVYLRLPWKGLRPAEMVLQAVKKAVNPAFPPCEVRVVYSSRTAFQGIQGSMACAAALKKNSRSL